MRDEIKKLNADIVKRLVISTSQQHICARNLFECLPGPHREYLVISTLSEKKLLHRRSPCREQNSASLLTLLL
jgi:hypothetical protein